MIVCAKCNRAMRPKKNGVAFTEMAQDRPYKLWMADLWQCQDCGAEVLYSSPTQKPIAEHFQTEFVAKLASFDPQYQAKEWNRPREEPVAASFPAPLPPNKFRRLSDKEISDGVIHGLQRSSGCFE